MNIDNNTEDRDNQISFTVFTSPNTLTKHITLLNGEVQKTLASSYVNRAERVTRLTLGEVMEILNLCTQHQAVGWGVHAETDSVVAVQTTKEIEAEKAVDGAIARSKKYLSWPNSAGVMMFDIDTDHTPDSARTAIIAAYFSAFGKDHLTDVEMYYRPSSSSGVYVNDELPKMGGRIYIAVEKAEDIPRIGDGIEAGLWVNGYGRIESSKSGSSLVRCLVDTSVWSPERLDFVFPAILGEGVARIDQGMKVWGTAGTMVPELESDVHPTVTVGFNEEKTKALEAEKPMLDAVREQFIVSDVEKKKEDLAAEGVTEGDAFEKMMVTYEKTLRDSLYMHILGPHFIIYLNSDMTERVSVADILKEPNKYNNRPCCDPNEPEGTFNKAKIFTNSYPIIHSFMHGGQRYKLRNTSRIIVKHFPENLRADHVRETVKKIKQAFPGQVYRYGERLVYVTQSGALLHLDADMLRLYTSDALDFIHVKYVKGEFIESERSMPLDIADSIMSSKMDDTFVSFPNITQTVKAPFIFPDTGEIISDFGYHSGSKTFLFTDQNFPDITPINSKANALGIAQRLVEPYTDFNLYNYNNLPNYHKAVVLTMILSAQVRSFMNCPNYLINASHAGVGKSYFMRCIIAEKGERLYSISWSYNNVEQEKRLATEALKNPSYLAIDNYDGIIGGCLENFTDKEVTELTSIRTLGTNTSVSIANNMLIIANGINIRPAGGAMARRSMLIPIAPPDDGPEMWQGRKMKLPYAPSAHILSNWRERHMLGLSLITWGHKQRLSNGDSFTGSSNGSSDVVDSGAMNSLKNFDHYIKKLVMAIYGVNVVDIIVEDTEEVNSGNDVNSPKGLLYYYAWEMVRLYSGTQMAVKKPDVVKNGKFTLIPATEDNLEAAKTAQLNQNLPSFLQPENMPPIDQNAGKAMFTIKTFKDFVAFNNLDPNGQIAEITKTMKLLGAAGQFNGMKFVRMKDKDPTTKNYYWRVDGMPNEIPLMNNGVNQGFGGNGGSV